MTTNRSVSNIRSGTLTYNKYTPNQAGFTIYGKTRWLFSFNLKNILHPYINHI